jgi:hypothetical protein
MSNSKGRNIGGDMLPVAGPLPFNLIFFVLVDGPVAGGGQPDPKLREATR